MHTFYAQPLSTNSNPAMHKLVIFCQISQLLLTPHTHRFIVKGWIPYVGTTGIAPTTVTNGTQSDEVFLQPASPPAPHETDRNGKWKVKIFTFLYLAIAMLCACVITRCRLLCRLWRNSSKLMVVEWCNVARNLIRVSFLIFNCRATFKIVHTR